jgi:hypothetical protein
MTLSIVGSLLALALTPEGLPHNHDHAPTFTLDALSGAPASPGEVGDDRRLNGATRHV